MESLVVSVEMSRREQVFAPCIALGRTGNKLAREEKTTTTTMMMTMMIIMKKKNKKNKK